MELFVYWKLRSADLGAATAALATAQATLQQRHLGLRVAAYRRAEPAGDTATLMETYAAPSGITAALHLDIDAIADAATAAWRTGPRHVEVFERLPPR